MEDELLIVAHNIAQSLRYNVISSLTVVLRRDTGETAIHSLDHLSVIAAFMAESD